MPVDVDKGTPEPAVWQPPQHPVLDDPREEGLVLGAKLVVWRFGSVQPRVEVPMVIGVTPTMDAWLAAAGERARTLSIV